MTGTLRRPHVIALVVAGVLFVAAAVFMLASISDRDGAHDDVVQGRQELAAQKLALQDAQDQLVAARSAAAATTNAFTQVLALERQLADTMSQGVDADQVAQSLGASEAPDVASYNAAISQANALAEPVQRHHRPDPPADPSDPEAARVRGGMKLRQAFSFVPTVLNIAAPTRSATRSACGRVDRRDVADGGACARGDAGRAGPGSTARSARPPRAAGCGRSRGCG